MLKSTQIRIGNILLLIRHKLRWLSLFFSFSLFIFMSKCTFKSTKNIKLFLSLSSFLSISCTYILLSSLHSFHPSLSVVRYILRCSLVVLISDLYSYLFSFLLDLDSLDRAVIVVIIIFVIVI